LFGGKEEIFFVCSYAEMKRQRTTERKKQLTGSFVFSHTFSENEPRSKPRSVLEAVERKEFRMNFAQKNPMARRTRREAAKGKKKTCRFGGDELSGGRGAIKLVVVRHAPVENVNATAPLPAA